MKTVKFLEITSILILSLFVCYPVNAFAGTPNQPTVHIEGLGDVIGAYEDVKLHDGTQKKIRFFSAIPYAETMTPDKRWTRSMKKKPFGADPYDATSACPSCPQLAPSEKQQEDCLYLRIATPANAKPGSKFPVMVFIHGGGFQGGGANEAFYNSGSYIAGRTDVVVVTINYRLGILGFMVYHGKGETDTSSGNFGLWDQKLAIQFIRDNIAAFGGDDKNITLFGESAGAMSIGFHLMMAERDHFDAAIMQSNLYSLPYLTEDEAASLGNQVLDQMSCPDLECLRKKELKEIMAAGSTLGPHALKKYGLKGIFHFRPVIRDQTFDFDSQPINAVPDKPLIVGTNENEGPLIALGIQHSLEEALNIESRKLANMSEAQFESLIHLLFKDENARKILEPVKSQYRAFMGESDCRFPAKTSKYYTLFSRILSDYMFTCANLKYAFNAAAKGSRLYAYHFTHISSCNPWPYLIQCGDCVCHTAELPYVFSSFSGFNPECTNTASWERLKPQEYMLSDRIIDYWTRFASVRNPGPSWPRFADLPFAAQLLELKIEPSPMKAASLAAEDFYLLYSSIIESENL